MKPVAQMKTEIESLLDKLGLNFKSVNIIDGNLFIEFAAANLQDAEFLHDQLLARKGVWFLQEMTWLPEPYPWRVTNKV